MTPKSKAEVLRLYRVLMYEARLRIDLLNPILEGKTNLPDGMIREICYLQLRILCELIALGCLIVHGDISRANAKKLANLWSAEKIVEKLEVLHPHFYPMPVILDGKKITVVNAPKCLSKSQLISLYKKCGSELHRGTLQKILHSKQESYGKINLAEIVSWAQKIENLLGTHLIVSSDVKTSVLCVLRDSAREFTTTTILMEREQLP